MTTPEHEIGARVLDAMEGSRWWDQQEARVAELVLASVMSRVSLPADLVESIRDEWGVVAPAAGEAL